MIRVLLFVLLLTLLAVAEVWLVERPGEIVLTWQGHRITTSLVVALGILLAAGMLLAIAGRLLRFVFRIPTRLSTSTQARRRDKGYAALSRGMIAVGEGDVRLARQSAAEAQRFLRNEPLALLLKAQAAQLADDRQQAEAVFKEMSERKDTRLLGLRGLHMEAQRRGDAASAHRIASTAHEIAALPWTAKAVLDHRTATADWQSALKTLQNTAATTALDKKTRERQLAVVETAVALDKEESAPNEALRFARSAIKREPNLVPAVAVTARLLARKGALRKATRLIETAWLTAPHPDLATAYVDLRGAGGSNAERLARAQTLARLAPNAPEGRMAVAQAAIAAGAYKIARDAMLPLIEAAERPTAGMCLIMADLERAEHGASGYVAEWLARASRAAHDPAWVADGVVSDHWLPASPVTGKLDAFVWQRPIERLNAATQTDEAVFVPLPAPTPPQSFTNATGAKALAAPEPRPEEGVERHESPLKAGLAPEPEAPNEPSDLNPSDRATHGDTVIFPLPNPPDDPGPVEKQKPQALFNL